MEETWTKLGRQPRYAEMHAPLSKYSSPTYQKRFGTWGKALKKFIEYINSDTENISVEKKKPDPNDDESPSKEVTPRHKSKRQINDRLRVQVLIKDGNTCKICGKIVTGDGIHIDHINPWAKVAKQS